MKQIHFKQIIFVALGIFTLSRYIHFSDYCDGMAQGLLQLLLLFAFISFGIILIITDLFKCYKKLAPFNWFTPIFLISIVSYNGFQLFFKEDNQKDIFLSAESTNDYNRMKLTFYRDSVFEKRVNSIENSCFTFGKYSIHQNKITLLKDELDSKKDFEESYILKDSLLIPAFNELKDTLKIID